MSIEAKIQELQLQLEIKKAWLAVSVSFGRGNKISDEIKEAITEEIEQFCLKRAEGLESQNTDVSSTFSKKELEVLKNLAQTALTRKPKTSSEIKETPKPQTNTNPTPNSPLMVEILRTDNISYPESKELQPGDQVQVVGFKQEYAIIRTKTGKQFGVLKEDLGLSEQ